MPKIPEYDVVAAKIEPDAVKDRIRRHRMGALTVRTRPGAEVQVRQARHEFPFGTAITSALAEGDPIAMSDADRKMFLKVLEENFNHAVHENALKWCDVEREKGKPDYSSAERIWELCAERGISMRGHCLFWEKEDWVQPWLRELDSGKLRAAAMRRGAEVTSRFKGRISEFDLNNEMIHGSFWRRRLGWGIVNEMALAARSGNPDAVLFLNDYGILVEGGHNANAYLEQIKALLDEGVPIGGIGCQAHSATFLNVPVDPVIAQRNLDRLSRFGLPIKITECLFDHTEDPEEQADQMRSILPIYFAHPEVSGILFWGFWAGMHWHPWAAFWKEDWTPTPQGLAYRDLVYKEWWTAASGKADSSGTFRTEAFFGDYQVSSMGKSKEAALRKKDGSALVTIE
jgi:endo-1,4-beta-xylanase